MKKAISILLISITTSFYSQNIDFYTKDGYVAEGYDVVSYFTKKAPLKGKKSFETSYQNAKFKFLSKENLELFKMNPTKYIPQYGGYCAYAVAAKNTKMYIDAEAYEIRDGKLYLFYSTFFGSKLDDWLKEDTKKLQQQGDKNWELLKDLKK
jgi:YHS domain-containing protein